MVKATELRRDATSVVFDVSVREPSGETRHEVSVKLADLARLARKEESPAHFVERCFDFLLERESKESILRRFDVSVIGTYFPEFEKTIKL